MREPRSGEKRFNEQGTYDGIDNVTVYAGEATLGLRRGLSYKFSVALNSTRLRMHHNSDLSGTNQPQIACHTYGSVLLGSRHRLRGAGRFVKADRTVAQERKRT